MTSPGNEPNASSNSGGIPFTPPPAPSQEKPDLDKEVDQALGGLSIEQLMDQSTSHAPATPSGGGGKMDPSRPVRGGRPGPRGHGGRHQHEDHINPDNIKRGKIVAIRQGNVFVDIGGKSQGICPIDQFDQAPGTDEAGKRRAWKSGRNTSLFIRDMSRGRGW